MDKLTHLQNCIIWSIFEADGHTKGDFLIQKKIYKSKNNLTKSDFIKTLKKDLRRDEKIIREMMQPLINDKIMRFTPTKFYNKQAKKPDEKLVPTLNYEHQKVKEFIEKELGYAKESSASFDPVLLKKLKIRRHFFARLQEALENSNDSNLKYNKWQNSTKPLFELYSTLQAKREDSIKDIIDFVKLIIGDHDHAIKAVSQKELNPFYPMPGYLLRLEMKELKTKSNSSHSKS